MEDDIIHYISNVQLKVWGTKEGGSGGAVGLGRNSEAAADEERIFLLRSYERNQDISAMGYGPFVWVVAHLSEGWRWGRFDGERMLFGGHSQVSWPE